MFASALGWSTLHSATPAGAAGETIISTFYVPLFEDNARAALFAVNGGTGTQLSSTTSVTVGAEDAIIYYDNWEDGYEAAANVRTQSTTSVFGDGDTANGNAATYCVPARCAGDNLPVGAVLRLNNSATVVPGAINTPRSAATVVFDGRDKISSTDGLAVTHASWPTAIDALHSEMAAAFDTSRWGVSFSAPVGVNTPAQGAGTASFSYTGIEVMAREAGTQVYIDTNNNGVYTDAGDVNGTTIGEGQTVYVNGNVREGAKVVTTKAAQVFMMTGVIGSNYENRSFQVFPTEGLVNDYVAPASSARASGTLYATVLYLFNPQTSAITVNVQTPSGTTAYSIPAGQTLNPAPVLANGEGARVTSAATFAAVAGIGTREVAGNSLNYDWGYSLLPARVITDSLVVGWAPGSQNLSVSNYDPVWVVTLAPTTLFVDFDADPTTGANTDPNGSRYDTAITVVTALSQLRITDTTDNDMTGAHIYTVDGVGVAAAYGEDPNGTPVAFPGIDLGTTLFPSCGALCVRKLATISVDVDGDGLIDPGDTLLWSVEATNTDYYTLINPVLFDTLPSGLEYVPGSTSVIIDTDPPVAVADDVVPPAATLFPYDGPGRQISANIPVGGVVAATFQTVVDPSFAGTAAICNRAIVISQRETLLTPANGADTGCVPVDGLRITKTSSSGGNPVLPGQALSYTMTVTNASSATLTGLAVTDPLPAGLTWVDTAVTRPALAVSSTTVADDFQSAGVYTGSSGTTAWSGASWAETDDGGGGATGGLIRKVTDLGDLSIGFLATTPSGNQLQRTAGDLSTSGSVTLSVDTRCASMESGDSVVLEIRPIGSGGWTNLDTFNTCDDAAYQANSYTLTSGQWGTNTQVRFRVTDSFSSGGGDAFYFDNVVFTASTTSRVVSTVPGAAPPALVTLTDLLAGESATIVVNTTVNSPYTATDEVTNIATVRTGNQVAKATVVDCVRCFDFSDDPGTFNGSGGLDPGRARATSPRTFIADTFQSIGYSGSTGTASWSAASWTEADTGGAGPAAGLVQNVIDASTRAIRIGSASVTAGTTTTLSRVIGDLSSYTSVYLAFEYRCSNLAVGDVVELQVRPTGAAAWATLQTFTSCNHPTIYSSQDLTLAGADYGTATEIRLSVTSALEANEFFFFDDVQIRAIADGATIGPRLGTAFDREVQGTGGASPFPVTAPAAPTGDDLSGVDDEDGVVVPAVDVNTLDVPITVTDATGGVSYVNGWFDWSNDGTFQVAESLFAAGTFASATGGLTVVSGTGQVPGPGTYTVTINVPDLEANGSGYAIGNTLYSRFRVATELSGVGIATAASSDGEVEDYSTTLNTLPVSISFVGSRRTGGKVTVDWRTAQEVDNLGFNLYAAATDGTLTKLNDELVLTQAPTSIEAHDYSLTVATTAGTFWIEDISLDGATDLHGPYAVGQRIGDPAPPQQIDWAPAREQVARSAAASRRAELRRARAESARRVASPAAAAVGPVARLEVTEAGVQEVTYEQLLA
ncbi:MAG: GEVED domain-containing protein, partial [Actinomycetota bacterium]|nr:GEVED domain-containing protein [Actinomycetota bacterium]